MWTQTQRVLGLAAGVLLVALIVILICAGAMESSREKAMHTWQMRLTIHGGRESVGAIDARESDKDVAKNIEKMIRPVFDVAAPEEGKSVATLVIEHKRVHTAGASKWEKLRNRIKDNLGFGYRESSVTFSETVTIQREFMRNPSGGVTLGSESSERGLTPQIEFPPEYSPDDRAGIATSSLLQDFKGAKIAVGAGDDEGFADDMLRRLEKKAGP